jgi:hypothetical protein
LIAFAMFFAGCTPLCDKETSRSEVPYCAEHVGSIFDFVGYNNDEVYDISGQWVRDGVVLGECDFTIYERCENSSFCTMKVVPISVATEDSDSTSIILKTDTIFIISPDNIVHKIYNVRIEPHPRGLFSSAKPFAEIYEMDGQTFYDNDFAVMEKGKRFVS